MLVQPSQIRIKAPTQVPEESEILTSDALEFVGKLNETFSSRRDSLLRERTKRQHQLDKVPRLDFLKETKDVRSSSWRVAPAPRDLQDRRVEITGPSGDTKMVINALNSGALTYMADFEDAQSPTWEQTIQGQINLRDAIQGTTEFRSTEGKSYRLSERTSVLIVRPRGWHLSEKHLEIDGRPVSASLFDFGLFLFHNADKLRAKGTGPYFYLPKLESHLEARLWNDVFEFSERELGIPAGSIRATVLIETITAAFEMDEILYELREHSAGLNCGRWDYIFSFIKKFRNHAEFVLPDRATVTMDKGFLKAYVDLLVKTCHRRGAHAIGGMSAYIPVKGDEAANKVAFEKVRDDKLREVRAGHDGTWVAHPGLVSIAKDVFDEFMPGPNQLENKRDDVEPSAEALLSVPPGQITEAGLMTNISVGIQYLASWFSGRGAAPINNLMEDAATAEICRAQLWQWINHGSRMSDGRTVTLGHVRHIEKQELAKLKGSIGHDLFALGNYELAALQFDLLISTHRFPEFLTVPAYVHLLSLEKNKTGVKLR
jgi:malate synthase